MTAKQIDKAYQAGRSEALQELKERVQQRKAEIELSANVSNEEMGRIRELRSVIETIEDMQDE